MVMTSKFSDILKEQPNSFFGSKNFQNFLAQSKSYELIYNRAKRFPQGLLEVQCLLGGIFFAPSNIERATKRPTRIGLNNVSLNGRCGRIRKLAFPYLVSIFSSCSSLHNLSQRTNFKTVIKTIFLTPRSKCINVLYYKYTITLITHTSIHFLQQEVIKVLHTILCGLYISVEIQV